MVVLPLTVEAVGQVLYNLRPGDRREIEATVHRFDSQRLAEATCACRLGFVAAAADLTPVAVLAAGEPWPGVWQLGLFATPRWPEVGRAVTRFAKPWLEKQLRALGAHRAQVREDQQAPAHVLRCWPGKLKARACTSNCRRNATTPCALANLCALYPRICPQWIKTMPSGKKGSRFT